MRLRIRRIGNSFGVIVPKATLDSWGVGEGDSLELTARGIGPRARPRSVHDALDEHKRKLAATVAGRFAANQIRAHSLGNLHRWRASGSWVSAYDEWTEILRGDGKPVPLGLRLAVALDPRSALYRGALARLGTGPATTSRTGTGPTPIAEPGPRDGEPARDDEPARDEEPPAERQA